MYDIAQIQNPLIKRNPVPLEEVHSDTTIAYSFPKEIYDHFPCT